MKDLKEIIKDVERDLVINITLGVKYKKIKLREARKISKVFMASYPYKEKQVLFENLYILSTKHRVARKVYIKNAPEFEEEKKKGMLKKMRNYMRLNDYENAIRIAKGGS